jgi:general nucleoside transport system permease protein
LIPSVLAEGLFKAGFFQVLSHPILWESTLAFAAPLLLASVGGCISERSGVVNIGMEGMMLISAFFGAFTVDKVSSLFGLPGSAAAICGVLGAIGAGSLTGWLHAWACVRMRANQVVSGMAINLLALGVTNYLLLTVFQNGSTPANLAGIPSSHVPILGDISFLSLGSIFFSQNVLVYVALASVLAAHVFLFRTKLGLRLRSVGENPDASETAGIDVRRVRHVAVIVSGALCGLAGAYIALNGPNGSFTDNMTAGRGFIALAALIVGRWTPLGALGACLLFGFGASLDNNLSGLTLGTFQVSGSLLDMLPYLITIVAVAGLIGRSAPPAAGGVPYDPAEAE